MKSGKGGCAITEEAWARAHDRPTITDDYQAGWLAGRDSIEVEVASLRDVIVHLEHERHWLQVEIREANVQIGKLRDSILQAARVAAG